MPVSYRGYIKKILLDEQVKSETGKIMQATYNSLSSDSEVPDRTLTQAHKAWNPGLKHLSGVTYSTIVWEHG